MELKIVPEVTTDPTPVPADTVVTVRTDSGGRPQVRLSATPDDPTKTPTPEVKPEVKPEVIPTRPEWLPAKFETPDALKASTLELLRKENAPAYVVRGIQLSESGAEVSALYAELEAKAGKRSAAPVPAPAVKVEPIKAIVERKPKLGEDGKPVLDAEGRLTYDAVVYVKEAADKAYEVEHLGPVLSAILDTAQVSGRQLEAEYAANGGKLSEETYARLAKAGANRAFVNGVIQGFTSDAKTIADSHIADIKAGVGGPEAFDAMATWARANVPAEELEAFNAAVTSGNLALTKKAVKDLAAQHQKAIGKAPTLLKAVTGVPDAGGEKFNSTEEVKAAMRDPRYTAGDKAYHAMIERKLKNSTVI